VIVPALLTAAVLLVNGLVKVSKADPEVGTPKTLEIVTGIDPTGVVIEVVPAPLLVAVTTAVAGGDSKNCKSGMKSALADLVSASAVKPAIANRVSVERMVLLLPL